MATFPIAFWNTLLIFALYNISFQMSMPALVPYFRDYVGYDYYHASMLVSLPIILTSVYMLFTGAITDHIEFGAGLVFVGLSVLLGKLCILMVSPTGVPLPLLPDQANAVYPPTGSIAALLMALVGFVPLAWAMVHSVILLATAYYGTRNIAQNSGFNPTDKLAVAFGLQYGVDQLSEFAGTALIDLVRVCVPVPVSPYVSTHAVQSYMVLAVSIAPAALGLLLALSMTTNRFTRWSGCRCVRKNPFGPETGNEASPEHLRQIRWPLRDVKTILRHRLYWRTLLLTGSLLPVRLLPYVMSAAFPVYGTRHFGSSFSYGVLMSLDPLVSFFTSFLMQYAFRRAKTMVVVILGVLVACGGMALLTTGTVGGTVAGIIIHALGNSLWSPRISQFIMEHPSEHTRGLFNALVRIPHILPELAIGPLVGWLLTEYCPSDVAGVQPCRSWMWLVTAGIGSVSVATFAIALLIVVVWDRCLVRAHDARKRARGSARYRKEVQLGWAEAQDAQVRRGEKMDKLTTETAAHDVVFGGRYGVGRVVQHRLDRTDLTYPYETSVSSQDSDADEDDDRETNAREEDSLEKDFMLMDG